MTSQKSKTSVANTVKEKPKTRADEMKEKIEKRKANPALRK